MLCATSGASYLCRYSLVVSNKRLRTTRNRSRTSEMNSPAGAGLGKWRPLGVSNPCCRDENPWLRKYGYLWVWKTVYISINCRFTYSHLLANSYTLRANWSKFGLKFHCPRAFHQAPPHPLESRLVSTDYTHRGVCLLWLIRCKQNYKFRLSSKNLNFGSSARYCPRVSSVSSSSLHARYLSWWALLSHLLTTSTAF